jgi:hypothetical protein
LGLRSEKCKRVGRGDDLALVGRVGLEPTTTEL